MSTQTTPRAALAAAVREIACVHRDHPSPPAALFDNLDNAVKEIDAAVKTGDRTSALEVVGAWRAEALRLLEVAK